MVEVLANQEHPQMANPQVPGRCPGLCSIAPLGLATENAHKIRRIRRFDDRKAVYQQQGKRRWCLAQVAETGTPGFLFPGMGSVSTRRCFGNEILEGY